MTRSALFTFALFLGTFTVVGCGGSATIEKPEEGQEIVDSYDEMSEADQAAMDAEMAKEMGN